MSGPAVFDRLDLLANIETIGVIASGANLPESAHLMYRQAGNPDWLTGHPLLRIKDGRLAGSLFGLRPATRYEIKVIDGSTEVESSTTTQPDELQFTPSAVVYVNDDAPAGGNGTATAPFRTIQEGVNAAGPGTQVLVADGLYKEAVSFQNSGTPNHWIQVKATGEGAILDSALNLSGPIWSRVAGKKNVWSADLGYFPGYLARDGKRFYLYEKYSWLLEGRGHKDEFVSEGWYMAPSGTKITIRSLTDPAGHTWQAPQLEHAFDVTGREWIWIEGFEIRFYGRQDGCGVCALNSSHLVIRGNRIHNLQKGIFINWTGGEERGNDTRVEFNEIYDPAAGDWPWNALKGTSLEGTAIILRGHNGAIVRGNELHDFFNGIYSGSSAALDNTGIAFDTDIYYNRLHHIRDDAFEPEGACINNRFRNNSIDSSYVGLSLAPVTRGPVWVLRSTFTNFNGRGIKFDRDSDGLALVYQNTFWSDAPAADAMDLISPVHNAILRNNIFYSNGYAISARPTGSSSLDWNNDNWYTTRPAGLPPFKWENKTYNSLAEFCAAAGLECSGFEHPPGLVNPAGGDFTLLPSSPNVDRGERIPGINDRFHGSAPDLGANEFILDDTPAVTPEAGYPSLTNILRADPNPVESDRLRFTVNFSEPVSGVDAGDFSISTSGNISGASIVEISGSGSSFTVVIDPGSGGGSLGLNLSDNDSIVNEAGSVLGGPGAGNGSFTGGERYTLDRSVPVVNSILRADPNPTVAGEVRFRVTFSEQVSGVNSGDFSLVTTGTVSGAHVTSLAEGNPTSEYLVTVNTGAGDGTVRLYLIDNDSISDPAGHPLGGAGLGNGSFSSGETYTKSSVTLLAETFRSNSMLDGWILESTEASGQGGSINTKADTLSLGDDGRDRQYRVILSFPTSHLPEGAVIVSAILSIKRQGLVGSNPFHTHGNILVDLKKAAFNIGFQRLSDFQAPANLESAGVIQNNPVDDYYWSLLDPASYRYINTTGPTQVRLRFQTDDNDDLSADYLKFYSGDYDGRQVFRPRLDIQYYLP